VGGDRDHPEFAYRAFISYAHADKRHARRIQRSLEAYRVPQDVPIDGLTKDRRIGRVFRDDDDLSAAPDLSEALKAGIRASENLVVIGSPRAAASKWVGREIEFFHATHPRARVFAVVFDGVPNSPDAARESFPDALKACEPLAPDARKESKLRVATRLAAGMLGVDFDDLWKRSERDARRRSRRRLAVQAMVTAAIAGLLVILYRANTNLVLNAVGIAQAYASDAASGSPAGSWRPTARQSDLVAHAAAAAQRFVTKDYDAELKQRDPEAGWTMAQELAALHGRDPTADAAALALMTATELRGTACWPEYVSDGVCHTGATAWVLYTQAALGRPADPASLESLIDAQSPQGWWPMYFSLRSDPSYASTYASAWALMAIDAQSRFAPPALRPRLIAARARAVDWLLSAEDAHGRWKDYPANPAGVELDGVSAVALVALNQSPADPRVARVDRAWLNDLPIYPGSIEGVERSNIALGASWKWDRTTYVVAPWIALSADLALPRGTRLGRAMGETYLDRFDASLASYDPAPHPNYLSAELVLCLDGISAASPRTQSPA
jgi:hypothetical protein